MLWLLVFAMSAAIYTTTQHAIENYSDNSTCSVIFNPKTN